ncbi:psychosine receptor [Elgaria multicarinata webbii]|uniref:psychosine receptor n=1 Tax=Elgaria multicarinata webbii TaxID=159646 RepID=UPI002FCD0929
MNCSEPNTTCEVYHELDRHLFPVLYSILIIISIPANCAALYISCSQVKKKNELGIYLLSLTLADLLYTLTLPFWIYYAQNGDNWTLPKKLCKISAFLKYLNYYTSSGFLTCISLDRYLAVAYPLRFHYLRTRRFAVLISVLVWAFEIMSNYQILKECEIFPHNGTINDSHTLCYDTYPLEKWQAKFNFYRIVVGYAIPLAVMVFCYQKIYQAVKHNQATQNSDKKKINHLLLSIIVTFVLCFTPYHGVLLIRSIFEPGNCCFAITMFIPYRIATALTSLNCIADPILYCFVSETGRTDIWNMLKCGSSVSQTDARQSQNAAGTNSSQDRKIPETETFL